MGIEFHCMQHMFVVYIIVGTCCKNMQANRVNCMLNRGCN